MRRARGFRSLRLPCVVWLVLLSLAAGQRAGDREAAARKDDAGGGAASTALADLASPLSATDLEVTGGAEGARAAAGRRGKAEAVPREHRGGRRLDEDEASRILWRGWLLVDEAASRRKAHITPKSVFIAPVIRGGDGTRGGGIPACAEGYRSDAMGRCHKVVRVNQAAHLDFLLQRLNALYGEPSSAASQGAAEKGPLLVTIPLATDPPQGPEDEGEEEEDGDEGDGRVDLVVVAEASIQEGPLKDLTGSFTGLEEQVVAESHDDTVMKGGESLNVDGVGKKAIDKSSLDSFESVPEKGKTNSEVVKNTTNDQRHESAGGPIVAAPITNRPELGEPVTFWEGVNSTEETSEQTEIPVTESTIVPTTDDQNVRFTQTTTFEPTESPSEDTDVEGSTTSVEHFQNTHIYETTFITDYPTTDSYDNKVTMVPEVVHNASEEISPEKNYSSHNKSDNAKNDPPSRVVFPGKVSDRVRFPDSEDQDTAHPSQPISSASSVSPSIASLASSKASSRPWGGWNRPMLLKFWTQMPLIREPSHGSESTIKRASVNPSSGDVPAHLRRGESWSFPIHGGTQGQVNHGPYQRRPWIYYQELSPREMASVSRVFDRVRHYENHG